VWGGGRGGVRGRECVERERERVRESEWGCLCV
jgi:hypothetical protein